MKKLENKIISTINKCSMLSDCEKIVVAVSGGADSMCLLHFFNKFSSFLHINNVICAHVNHGIRGEEADRDEAFVRNFCLSNGIRFESAHFDVPAIAEKTGESQEQCGRRLRYEFFDSVCEGAKIATAHNLNDSAETFLFNLSRGTGLKGLTGIPSVRDNIIRPLSDCTRNEIEQYLADEGVEYVTDSTNLLDNYSRNKIRHNVLPVLCELNDGFFNVFASCIDTLGSIEAFLSEQTDKAFLNVKKDGRFVVQGILECEDVIRKRLLIKIAEYYGAKDIENKHIQLLSSVLFAGGAVMLHGKIKIVSDGKLLYKEQEKLSDCIFSVPLSENVTEYDFPSCIIRIQPVDKEDIKNYNMKELAVTGCLDAEKIASAVLRSRQAGDRFTFPTAVHSKSLKNLYKEKSISPSDRWGIPLLADNDNILWINGVGASAYGAVNEKTKEIIRITVTRKV